MADRYTVLTVAVVFGLLAVGIVAVVHDYQDARRSLADGVDRTLSAIADSKVQELSSWRRERLGDAKVLRENLTFSALVKRFLEHPQDPLLRKELDNFLALVRESYGYDRIALLDPSGNVRMLLSLTSEPLSALAVRKARQTAESARTSFVDIYPHETTGKEHARVFVPILDHRNGNRVLAVVMLRIDPNKFLYPLLRRWTVPSATAETLLVRREGHQAVLLAPVRFKDAAVHMKRVGLKRGELAAVRAALGEQGVVDAVDYREVPVRAALRAVPDSPWFLVVKIDAREAYAPLGKDLWESLLAGCLMVLAAAAGLVAYVRWRRYALVCQMRYEVERNYRAVLDQTHEFIGLLKPDGTLLEINRAALAFAGIRASDVLGKLFWETPWWTHCPEMQNRLRTAIESAAQGELARFEATHRATDGAIHYIDFSLKPLVNEAGAVEFLIPEARDFTDRQRAEEAMREFESRLHDLIENSADGIVFVDVDTRTILSANRAMAAMLGRSQEKLAGTPVLAIHPPDSLAYVAARFEEHRLGQTHRSPNIPLLRADGSTVYADVTSTAVMMNGVEYLSESFHDVTDRKRVEEALQSALAYNRGLIEVGLDPIVTIGRDGKISDVNVAMEQATGLARDKLVGTDFCDYFTDPARARTGYRQVFRDGSVKDYTLELRHRDGRVMPVLCNAAVYRDEAGAVMGVFAAARDITERKRAEEVLRCANAYNRSLIEVSLDPLVTIGRDGRITDVNAATEEATGLPRATLVGTDFCDYFTDPARARAVYQQVFRDGLVRDYALELRHRDGHVMPVLYNAAVYRDEAGAVVGVLAAARDITDRKCAEEALEAVLAYNRGLIEASLDPLVTIGHDGQITDVNAAAEQATGLARSKLVGTDFSDYFTDPARARAGYEQVFRDGFVKDYALELRHRDGHVASVLYNAAVFRDEAGAVIGVFAAARDITERKRAEERAAHLAAIVESSDDAIIGKSLDGRIVSWNQGAERLYGYTAEEALGKPVSLIVPPDRVEELREMMARLARGETIEHFESRRLARNGRIVDVSLTISPIKDASGSVVGASSIARDITDRKQAEAERERLTARREAISLLQRSLLAPAPLADKLRWIADGVVHLFDAEFCRVWLVRPGDLCQQGCVNAGPLAGPHLCPQRERCLHLVVSAGFYTHTDGRMHRRIPIGAYKIGRIAAGTEPRMVINDVANDPRIENQAWARELGLVSFAGYRLHSPEGATLGVLGLFSKHAISASDDAMLNGVGSTAELILQQAAVEERIRSYTMELEHANSSLEQAVRCASEMAVRAENANRAKSEFLANMSHELRTPLNAVIGFSRGLLDRADRQPLSDHQTDRLEKVWQSGQYLLVLINKVLDTASLEAGRTRLTPSTFAAQTLVNELGTLAEGLLRAKPQVHYQADVEPNLPQLCTDRNLLRQILTNLIGNAVKFTDEGSVTLRVRRNGPKTEWSVIDTGCGIAHEHLEHIFEKFYQAPQAIRRSLKGTGLGLSLSKEYSALLGGTLTVQSALGQGTTFTLSIPTHLPEEEGQVPRTAAAQT